MKGSCRITNTITSRLMYPAQERPCEGRPATICRDSTVERRVAFARVQVVVPERDDDFPVPELQQSRVVEVA